MNIVDAVVPKKEVVASAVRLVEKIDEHGGYDRARIRGYINRYL